MNELNQINYFTAPGASPINWKSYAKALHLIVCDHYQMTREEIKTDNRSRIYNEPRQVLCYLMRKHSQRIPLREIGDMIGRNYATVIYGATQCSNLMEVDHEFRKVVRYLEKLAERAKRSTESDGSALTVGKLFHLPQDSQELLIRGL